VSAGISAGAVARRLGVAVTTLRTWHQRYGLGPSLHEPGQHRRYTPQDVARLEFMQRLITTGVPPAEAARWAQRLDEVPLSGAKAAPSASHPAAGTASRQPGRTATAPPGMPAGHAPPAMPAGHAPPGMPAGHAPPAMPAGHAPLGVPAGHAPPGMPAGYAPPAMPAGHAPLGVPAVERAASQRRDGGGLSLGAAHPAARGLSRAAVRLDAAGARRCLSDAVAEFGVVSTWDQVIAPVLIAIGNRHATRGDFVDVEHVVSGCVTAVLSAVPRPPEGVPARILLACADEEQHSLPLEALAAALAEQNVPARVLGARVPQAALTAAVRRTGPSAVLLWSSHPSTAGTDQLAAVIKGRWRPLLIAAAGPGWDPTALPPDVVHPGSLSDALALLVSAAEH